MRLKQILSLLILHTSYTLINAINECQTASNCSQCITVSPKCSWCQVMNYKEPSAKSKYYDKCDLLKNHETQKCPDIHNPKSKTIITKDAELKGDNRVSPKKVTLKLRPGQPTNISVRIKTPKNFPIDLYLLMDLSKSMADDLVQLIGLADLLSEQMRQVTSNFKLGFGGFIDKPLGPFTFTSPDEIKSLQEKMGGAPYTFSYKNYRKLTENTTEFIETVKRDVKASFNVDAPEGSLEALIQVVACRDSIGWRDKRKARRIVVIITDQTFHYTGDGLLAGVIKPNDGNCHLKDGKDYTAWDKFDYPSLAQVREAVIDSQIVPIFASLGNDHLYVDVAKFFGENSGAVADRLSNDSSNIVDIIKSAYEKIARRISINSDTPNGVDVVFSTNCGRANQPLEERSVCDDIALGQEVIFTTSVTGRDCKSSAKFQLKTDFDDVDVNLEMDCNCPCEDIKEYNSSQCTDRGTLSCGLCACNKGFAGRICQCTEEEAKNETLCRVPGSSGPICSGRGNCVCGECQCDPLSYNELVGDYEYVYGDQCQCTNTSCGRSNGGKICGGPDRGVCDCGKCICTEDWTGPACGESCPRASNNCVDESGVVCSGHGTCKCNRCVCDLGYIGELCEECVFNCPNPCEDFKECAKCLQFDTSELTMDECYALCRSLNLSLDFILVDSIDKDRRCIARDEDDCSVIFTSDKKHKYGEERVLTIRRERLCPAEADIMAIILGLIGAIVGIGLILIVIWRIIATLQDRREFAKFNEERVNPKWDTLDNPIFVRATSTFENPTYGQEPPPPSPGLGAFEPAKFEGTVQDTTFHGELN